MNTMLLSLMLISSAVHAQGDTKTVQLNSADSQTLMKILGETLNAPQSDAISTKGVLCMGGLDLQKPACEVELKNASQNSSEQRVRMADQYTQIITEVLHNARVQLSTQLNIPANYLYDQVAEAAECTRGKAEVKCTIRFGGARSVI